MTHTGVKGNIRWHFQVMYIIYSVIVVDGNIGEYNQTQLLFYMYQNILGNRLYSVRVEKSGDHKEHAPGTPKSFPRNT